MSVMPAPRIHGTPVAPPPGLSSGTQALWLAAQRYRLLADRLADREAEGPGR